MNYEYQNARAFPSTRRWNCFQILILSVLNSSSDGFDKRDGSTTLTDFNIPQLA